MEVDLQFAGSRPVQFQHSAPLAGAKDGSGLTIYPCDCTCLGLNYLAPNSSVCRRAGCTDATPVAELLQLVASKRSVRLLYVDAKLFKVEDVGDHDRLRPRPAAPALQASSFF